MVLPAPAGMSRSRRSLMIREISAPRASGDEPVAAESFDSGDKCSPRQRG